MQLHLEARSHPEWIMKQTEAAVGPSGFGVSGWYLLTGQCWPHLDLCSSHWVNYSSSSALSQPWGLEPGAAAPSCTATQMQCLQEEGGRRRARRGMHDQELQARRLSFSHSAEGGRLGISIRPWRWNLHIIRQHQRGSWGTFSRAQECDYHRPWAQRSHLG